MRCGRRWGKTLFGSTIICDGAARGESWGLFAPEYKFTAETYREIDEILDPIKKSGSKVDGVIRTISSGRVDFWTLNNPNAGRSRRYHGVVIDEAAFAGPDMQDIWEKSIKPSLLDFGGVCWVFSTPCGRDDDNWFYRICTDPGLGFTEIHAPTWGNPYLPIEEIAKLEAENSPEVYRQEYKAEFVDWSGVAFFPMEALLVDGKPVPMPAKCDAVFCTIDTAIKTGQEHDSTGVVFWSYNALLSQYMVNILDYDLVKIEGAAQADWLPSVHARGEELARLCGARSGYVGALIEDKATGTVLLQQSANLARKQGLQRPLARPIDSVLTAMGKDERAIAASRYVYAGDIKMTEAAFNKIIVHNQQSANHLIKQITGFRIGSKEKGVKDLLDCFAYGVLATRGVGSGQRKGI